MKKLTQALITEALSQSQDYYLSDHQIKGLTCRILPSGVKTYYFRYFSPMDKKQKKIRIDDAHLCSLDKVRIKAMEIFLEIKKGNDPLQKNTISVESQKKSLTLKEFWPRYEKEYLLINQKDSTRRTGKSKIRAVLNFFGDMKLEEIKASDVINFKNMATSKASFTTSLSYLRNALKYAEICELKSYGSNPCLYVKGWISEEKERYLTEEELSKVIQEIDINIKNEKASVYPYYAMLCLIYTGQRKNEIVKLKWKDIDFKQKSAVLHDSKVGKRHFILNDKTISILNQIPRQEGNEYIFCGVINNSHTHSINDAWYLIRAKINLEDVRIHDFRHTFASMAINNGIDIYSLSKLLGHSNINTTQRYAHLYKEKLIESANKIFK